MPPAGQKPQTFRKPADRNAAPRKAPGTDSRIQCFEVLRLVENGRHLDEALRHTRGLDDRDKRFVRLLAATCLRRAGQLDLILADLLDRPPSGKQRDAMIILRMGAAQLLFLETGAHAAVNLSLIHI